MPRFSGFNYLAWKLKMDAILIKDGCAIALKGKENRPEGMADKMFAEEDELAMANIYIALDGLVLFNVTKETMAKGLWNMLKNQDDEGFFFARTLE